jgi:Arc/MetJ-type ribon-helix-helix transcriptional regulator
MTPATGTGEMAALDVEASEELLADLDQLVEEGHYLTRSEAARAALSCRS